MNPILIWHFLLGAYELIYILVHKEKYNNYAENIAHHHTKFSHPGIQAPWICVPLAANTGSQ